LILGEKALQGELAEKEEAESLLDMLIQRPKVREAIKEALKEILTQGEDKKTVSLSVLS